MTCRLRIMQSTDLQVALKWRNRCEVRDNKHLYNETSSVEHQHWWDSVLMDKGFCLIVAEIEDNPVGLIVFSNYTGEQGSASWDIFTGDNNTSDDECSIVTAALEYAFNVLNIRRLECEILGFNSADVLRHRRAGFNIEGIKKQAYQGMNDWHDIYCLAILEKNWRFKIKSEQDNVTRDIPNSVTKTVLITDEMVNFFSDASKDKNAIHFNDKLAQTYGFKGRICHGMLVGSLFSGMFSAPPFGEGTIYLSQTLYFIKPIQVGAEVEVSIQVLSQIGRKLTLSTKVLHRDLLCIHGEADILLPKEISSVV